MSAESKDADGAPNERAREYLCGILERMGIPAEVTARDEEDKLVLDVACSSTDDVQRVIGRRGQVVDALQHLVGKMVGKGKSEGRGKPIVVDSGGYRQRHIDRLEGLAVKMAEKAKQSGRPVDLDPMPPHDRRVIHMAIAKVEGVATRSEGEGDLRHVVVLPA
jgi:spoIIIJ-associated protein